MKPSTLLKSISKYYQQYINILTQKPYNEINKPVLFYR